MDFINQMVAQNLGDYETRCEEAIRFLSQACSMSPEDEVLRFKRLMDTMGQVPQADGPLDPNNPFAALQAKVIEAMPPVVEFVTTHASSKLKGFGYLTEGRPGKDLPSTLMAKLENTFRICLTDGGGMEDGEILADTFKMVFPDLGQLANHSPLAQAMLMGFVPRGEKVDLKAYFNTRLGCRDHAALVTGLLNRLNLNDAGFYERIYQSETQAKFVGVGVDLHGDLSKRAKLYVKLPKSQVNTALNLLLGGQIHLKPEQALEEYCKLLDCVESDALCDEFELAISLRTDALPTLKLTAFFSSEDTSDQAEQSVARYLDSRGYDAKPLLELFEIMKKGVTEPGVKKQPVHGLGIEFPVEDQVKVNTYFNPLV